MSESEVLNIIHYHNISEKTSVTSPDDQSEREDSGDPLEGEFCFSTSDRNCSREEGIGETCSNRSSNDGATEDMLTGSETKNHSFEHYAHLPPKRSKYWVRNEAQWYATVSVKQASTFSIG